ncbi:MAG: hypothetical protein ACE37N_14665 [Pseudohongiellaceae bacterium]
MRANLKKLLPATVLAGAAAFFAYDILVDLLTGIDSMGHIVVEMLVFIAITLVLAYEIARVRSGYRSTAASTPLVKCWT